MIDWPDNLPIEGAITKPEDAVGHVLMYPLGAHEPIRQRDLAGANSGMGLSAKIPDGMRATAVQTNEVNNLAGFLFPGCKVDVLGTFHAGTDNNTMTRTILQDVQVLSTGTKMEPDPQGKPDNVAIVTLLTTPEQSEKLVLAENQGSIHFVLRNGGDRATGDTAAIDLAELSGLPKTTTPTPGRHEIAQKVAESYTVETIAGDKTSVDKF